MDNTTSLWIPKKYVDRVAYVDHDDDGWWIGLHDGWCCDIALHTIHEDTKSDVLQCLRNTILCTCSDCVIYDKKR